MSMLMRTASSKFRIVLAVLVILLVHVVIRLVRSVAPSSTLLRWYYVTSLLADCFDSQSSEIPAG